MTENVGFGPYTMLDTVAITVAVGLMTVLGWTVASEDTSTVEYMTVVYIVLTVSTSVTIETVS
jgi:hypothetical protein